MTTSALPFGSGTFELPPTWHAHGLATLQARVRLKETAPETLLTMADGSGMPTLTLLVRQVGDDPALTDWDRRQNYAIFAGAENRVLECVLATEPPRGLIEIRRKQHQAQREKNPNLPPFQVSEILERGLIRLGVPLSRLAHRRDFSVLVRLGGPRVELFVDGVLVDEDWPAGPLQPGSRLKTSLAVEQVHLWPGVLDDDAVVTQNGGPTAVDLRKKEILGADRPLGQYWAPLGHNTWAGDAMLTAEQDRLHLFWLTDRRMGSSKFGVGGCSFAHASTTDLAHWTFHPLAYPLTEYWEAGHGTGCVVAHEDGLYAFSTPLTERLNLTAQHPTGPYLACSRDGIHFHKEGWAGFTGEPGMVRDERGVYHAISSSQHADGLWRSSRYESTDLRHWHMADADFLPAPGWPPSRTVFSCECFNWFRWGDWWYILGGRTGYWRADKLLGPYRSVNDAGGPMWDLYDGLMVPQVAVWKGRGIMAGWVTLNDQDWGGHLVFRELHQRADGNLELQRLPELEPAGALTRLPTSTVEGTSGLCFVERTLAGIPSRIVGRLAADAQGRFGLRLGSGPAGTAGVELRFDAKTSTAQWGTPRPQELAHEASEMGYNAGDFAILNVEGLVRPFELDIRIHPDAKSDSVIVDAMIDRRRTLITRRKPFVATQITFFAENCRLTVD